MSLIKRPTKVELEHAGAVTLRPSDYMTQGGEGAIYRKGNRVLKLAHDPKTITSQGLDQKVTLLQGALSDSRIVAPKGMVFDGKRKPIGYHLPFVSGEPFPRLFTSSGQTQHQLTKKSIINLTTAMYEVVGHAHQAKTLMVDANELNWLADVSNPEKPVPYVIDVDSWQIDRFKASVVMPSIRDWHGPISAESDWFAWGIVSFLLYTGIHPYKGKLDGYKGAELERRMKDNASVFRPEVRLSKAVRDFAAIPGPLLDWYEATFEQGERTIPPPPNQTGAANTRINRVLRSVTTQTGGLIYERLLHFADQKIISVWPCGVIRTDKNTLIEISTKRRLLDVSGTRVAVVAVGDGYLVAEGSNNSWQWRFLSASGTAHDLSLDVPVQSVFRSGERLFVTTDEELIELELTMFGKPVLSLGKRWQVLSTATNWFAGVGVSDVLGSMHLVVPDDEDGVAMVRTPELQNKRVVLAKGSPRVVLVVTLDAQGVYEQHDFVGTRDWKSYNYTAKIVDGPELNQVVLPKGVQASIIEDGELTVTVPTQGSIKVVTDKDIFTTMKLAYVDNQVVYLQDGDLWSLRMQ